MDIAAFSQNNLLATSACAAFVLGVLFARVVFGSRRSAKKSEDPRNHLIRQLEVDLKLAERKIEECNAQLEAAAEEFDQSQATVTDLNQQLAKRDSEVNSLREEVRSETAKTRELRRELSERAAETIREHVRAEEFQTELAVARAGSEAFGADFVQPDDDVDSSHDDDSLR